MTARLDLLEQAPRLKPILRSRLQQPALTLVSLAAFTLAMLAGWLGTPVGSRDAVPELV